MSSQTIKHVDLRRGVENVSLKATSTLSYQMDANSFINTSNKPLPSFRFTTDDSITTDNRAGHLQAGLSGLLTEGGDSLVTEDGFNILME